MLPYIGVTGFMTTEEIEIIGETAGFVPSRPLMLGILASDKTLCGEPNKYPNRYPSAGRFYELIQAISKLQRCHRVFSAIHYHTPNRENFARTIDETLARTGYNTDALQLNIAWPSRAGIYALRSRHSKLKIILQIGPTAMHMLHNDPERIAEKVQEYDHLVDKFLIDVSGGTGKLFSTDFAKAFLSPLQIIVGDKLGVAGGLCADTLDVVREIAEEFPNISIDAEGRRRRPSDDTLHLKETKRYVQAALELFSAASAAG